MATTSAAIRDRMITVVQALTPTTLADTPFRAHREAGDFREWAMSHANACLRRFSIRDTFLTDTPDATNLDVEWVTTTMEFACAYPTTYRAGPDGMRDSDDLIEQDMHAIQHAIGTRGYGNFTDGVMQDADVSVEENDEVRVLNLTFSVGYYRAF